MNNRIKISATVDPQLLEAVDAFLVDHTESDRSKVIDDALGLWYARQQQIAMEAQFADGRSPEEEQELGVWKGMQQASARRLFSQG